MDFGRFERIKNPILSAIAGLFAGVTFGWSASNAVNSTQEKYHNTQIRDLNSKVETLIMENNSLKSQVSSSCHSSTFNKYELQQQVSILNHKLEDKKIELRKLSIYDSGEKNLREINILEQEIKDVNGLIKIAEQRLVDGC